MDEEKLKERMRQLKENHTYEEVAEILNREGFKTPRGKAWKQANLQEKFWKYGLVNPPPSRASSRKTDENIPQMINLSPLPDTPRGTEKAMLLIASISEIKAFLREQE